KTEFGFWATQRANVEDEELRQVRREVALFCELVKAHTGGRVAIQPQFEVDAEVITIPAGGNLMSITIDQVRGRLTPTIKSAFVLTSELDEGAQNMPVAPVPVTYVPVFATLDPQHRGKLARHLLYLWTRQAQDILSKGGIKVRNTLASPRFNQLRELDFQPMPDDILRGSSVWDELAKSDNFGTPKAVAAGSWPWSEVADDPWVKLPRLTAEQLREHGVQEFPLEARGTAQFGTWRLVQDRYVDLVGARPGLKAVGYATLGDRTLVAFEGAAIDATDLQLIGSPGLQDTPVPSAAISTSLPFNAGEVEKLAVGGFWQVLTNVDSDRGAVAEIRELPRPRRNWLRLVGNGTTTTAFDLAKTPFLEFWVKPRIVGQAVDLVAEGKGIKKRIRLFGRAMHTEARRDLPKDHVDLGLTQSSDWQFVSLDLRAMGTGEVSNLYLASPAESYDWTNFGSTFQIFLDDLKITDKASATVAELKQPVGVPAIAEATDPYSRAAAAANADDETLIKLMSDSNSLVALNAYLVYGDKNLPAAQKVLIDSTKSLSHRISDIAIRAVARTKTDEARALILTILKQGPFDHMKRFAAQNITNLRTDKTLAADLSILLASRSWQTRLAAGLATPRLDGDTAKIVGMAFVNDSEPYVRYLITKEAHIEVKEVEARVISLLDPAVESSPLVRVAAALKLSETKSAVVSKFMAAESRFAKLLCISLADKVANKSLLQLLATDSSEEVKAAALQKLN
ncbi:MAG: hypothetical protein ABL962_11025, partial [Fimbriimonadaceae bacterium]